MAQPIDRAGLMKVRLIKWAIRESNDPAKRKVQLDMVGYVEASWDPAKKAWDEFWISRNEAGQRLFADYEVWGSVLIFKNDGDMHEHGVRQLKDALGWDGDMLMFKGDPPPDTIVVMTVKEHRWNDSKTGAPRQGFRGEWLNHVSYIPDGGLRGRTSEDRLAEMNARLGSDLRAAISKLGEPTEPTPF